MNTYKKTFSLLILSLVLIFSTTKVQASTIPTMSLGFIDSTSIRLTVKGSPHSSIELHYGSGATASRTIGTTDDSGNFSTILNTQSYNLSLCNQTAYVVIDGAQSQIISWSSSGNSNLCSTNPSDSLTFSQNNIVLNAGQNFPVTILGAGGYSVSNNSNSSIISTTINGSQVNLYANTFGGANITICDSSSKCGVLYVVAVSGNAVQTSVTNPPAAISSFTVSSNGVNGYFMGAGNLLTLTFGANEQIGNVSATVGGSHIGISGNGSGPYTGTYTISGNEGRPIPVVINFADLDNRYTQTSFSVGGQSDSSPSNTVSTPTSNNTTTVAIPAVIPTYVAPAVVASDKYVFSSLIKLNSSGKEVTELQKHLTALGFYSGPINGKFGPLTEAAVKKFQKKHGISQTGYTGPTTRAALNK